MELTLQPMAKICRASGKDFAEHDRVICYLVREADGTPGRHDLLESADPSYTVPGQTLCRWVVDYKPQQAGENPARAMRLTAENLFLTLADSSAAPFGENTPMIQFLALMLERKRQLKARGLTPDRAHQIYEHTRTHQFFEVPVGELDEAFFVKIQGQLGLLLGQEKTAAASAEAPSAEAAPATGTGDSSPAGG